MLAFSCINKNEAQKAPSANQIQTQTVGTIDSVQIKSALAKLQVARRFHESVFVVYAKNQWHPIWLDKNGFNQHASLAAGFFWKFISAGLIDKSSFLPEMQQAFGECLSARVYPIKNLTESDIVFTIQCLIFLSELIEGKQMLIASQPEWYIPARKFSADTIIRSFGFPESILLHSPVHQQLIGLTGALNQLQSLERRGGLKPIAFKSGTALPGDSNIVIPKIRRWMKDYGVFNGDLNSTAFDSEFETALRLTRKSLGLKDTSLVDLMLIQKMNVPVKERIRTIRINMERWKWLPPDSSSTFIRVNIPDFTLEVVDQGVVIKKMKVIVGTAANHTIMFSDVIEHVVFSPYWNVPNSIFEKELWPIIRKNHSYLEKNEMEIVGSKGTVDPHKVAWHHYTGRSFPYRIRQKPGPQNALGLVKFSFPNPYGIYMHDTPNKELFEVQKRTFSHGCIRIEEPKWLAGYLLRGKTEWTSATMDSAMTSKNEQFVKLDQPMPVFITYFTSWVNNAGVLQFRDDVYGHDAKMAQNMFDKKK